MTITIRPFADDDSVATWKVFRAAVTGTAAAHYTAEQIAAWAPAEHDPGAWAQRRRRAWTVVAEMDGRVVGFADLTEGAELDMLFVHPDAGGRGVARGLVDAVLAEARRRGMKRVGTHASRSARPVLEHLGFVVDAENPANVIRGVDVPNFDMHVDLE